MKRFEFPQIFQPVLAKEVSDQSPSLQVKTKRHKTQFSIDDFLFQDMRTEKTTPFTNCKIDLPHDHQKIAKGMDKQPPKFPSSRRYLNSQNFPDKISNSKALQADSNEYEGKIPGRDKNKRAKMQKAGSKNINKQQKRQKQRNEEKGFVIREKHGKGKGSSRKNNNGNLTEKEGLKIQKSAVQYMKKSVKSKGAKNDSNKQITMQKQDSNIKQNTNMFGENQKKTNPRRRVDLLKNADKIESTFKDSLELFVNFHNKFADDGRKHKHKKNNLPKTSQIIKWNKVKAVTKHKTTWEICEEESEEKTETLSELINISEENDQKSAKKKVRFQRTSMESIVSFEKKKGGNPTQMNRKLAQSKGYIRRTSTEKSVELEDDDNIYRNFKRPHRKNERKLKLQPPLLDIYNELNYLLMKMQKIERQELDHEGDTPKVRTIVCQLEETHAQVGEFQRMKTQQEYKMIDFGVKMSRDFLLRQANFR